MLLTLSIFFVVLAVPMLAEAHDGSQLGGAVMLFWSAFCAAGAYRTQRLRVVISSDEVVVVNLRSTKTYSREQVERFTACVDRRVRRPVGTLVLANGERVIVDATNAYITRGSRAALIARLAAMNEALSCWR
jgi:hypothetical protein